MIKLLSCKRCSVAPQVTVLVLFCVAVQDVGNAAASFGSVSRIFEATFTSAKAYADPFNDVEVDVVFSKDEHAWRVPAFWRGGQRWTVRFAPPSPGEYTLRLESTDINNPDLNRQAGRVTVGTYRGNNPLYAHGPLRVSANRRYFEHSDGTPFYWLGDTWWTGLSDRLSWEGFRQLAADRKRKGFTLVQIVAGLVPGPNEERAPEDAGHRNEGGAVWEPQFVRINPRYFDYADRRILHLIDQGMVPAIVGGWNKLLPQMGVVKMKQHWRYIIGRYGAYPVIWIVGGEVVDPPAEIADRFPRLWQDVMLARGWTAVARYVRDTDPYHHPVTAHESFPPFDMPLQDESLMDFDLIQSSHWGWGSIATQVAQINMHYARTSVTKPIVQGEIGYEKLGETHFEGFQRTAFWLTMLSGAAGHTYGANGTWEAYTGDKPLHRKRHSFVSWEEGMKLPGSYQIGLGAKLLRQYAWWRFEPHPEWVIPRGTTLLAPHGKINDFDIGRAVLQSDLTTAKEALEHNYPGGEWQARGGDFRRPYAAGIPREVRIVYIPPQLSYLASAPPTVLGLEGGVRYQAYFWEPSFGTRIDLGMIERPEPGMVLFSGALTDANSGAWMRHRDVMTLRGIHEPNVAATLRASGAAHTGLVMRYQAPDTYIAAVYSPREQSLYLIERHKNRDDKPLGRTPILAIGARITLSAEIRENKAVASITDGKVTYTTPIVDLVSVTGGSAGVLRSEGQAFENLELRRSPVLIKDSSAPRKLHDARGEHRGDLAEPGWGSFGRDKHILLDAYRPEKLPTSGDWLLVLEARPNREEQKAR